MGVFDQPVSRPEFVKDEHLEFLDDLRESGVTNMFGATVYLVDELGLDKKVARQVLGYWIKSFGRADR
jgi:hypothetical protein